MYVQHESIRLAILKYLSDYKSRIHSLNNSVLELYTGKYINHMIMLNSYIHILQKFKK